MCLSIPLCLLTLLLLPLQSTQQALTNVPKEYQPRVEAAVHDCIAVATLVSVAFDDCSTTFLRYFQPGDADFVRRVFRRIANIAPDVTLTLNDYANVLQG